MSAKFCTACGAELAGATKCPNCGRQVGDNAATPVAPRKRHRLRNVAIGVGALLLIVAIASPGSADPGTPTKDAPTVATPTAMTATQACHLAERKVEGALKAPKTADFVGACWSGDGHNIAQSRDANGNPVWTVQGQVDSQNSFGAMIRTTWQVTVTDYGSDVAGVVIDWTRP